MDYFRERLQGRTARTAATASSRSLYILIPAPLKMERANSLISSSRGSSSADLAKTGMTGFAILDLLGLVTLNPKPFQWANILIGGILFGVGMSWLEAALVEHYLRQA